MDATRSCGRSDVSFLREGLPEILDQRGVAVGIARGRRAAEERDEHAPFHCPMPPVLLTERIAHLSYGRRLLRCGISTSLMTAVGQNAKNSH
jgi:hypothetical protein